MQYVQSGFMKRLSYVQITRDDQHSYNKDHFQAFLDEFRIAYPTIRITSVKVIFVVARANLPTFHVVPITGALEMFRNDNELIVAAFDRINTF